MGNCNKGVFVKNESKRKESDRNKKVDHTAEKTPIQVESINDIERSQSNPWMNYNLYPKETKSLFKEFFERDWVVSYLTKVMETKETVPVESSKSQEVLDFLGNYCNLTGIKLVIQQEDYEKDMGSWGMLYSKAEQKDLLPFIVVFLREFGVYSKDFFKKVNMTTLVFCFEAFIDFRTQKQYRASIPDYYDRMGMVYSIKEKSKEYITTVCHHELFHYVDYKVNGTYDSAEWRKFNTPTFKYGGGGHLHRKWKPLDPSIKGFINFYSTTAIEEDKAEIYRAIVAEANILAKYDSIVQQKIRHMKDLVLKYSMLSQNQLDLLVEYRKIES